jgi:putative FmdB family regulatory protein
MLKRFNFECDKCKHEFDDLVEGIEGQPDLCPECGFLKSFTKLASFPNVPTKIILDYPGSKRFKAGYQHTHADRPAEKKASQVSMHGSGGMKKK